mmetsp:Transcript_29210/g.93562  ORF Transcript_29210/g.93562 Transcript_29210/m.93562 type:complete len:541 (-) Transcript_29210:21-1643(-)
MQARVSAGLEAAAEKLRVWQDKIQRVDDVLHDPSKTQFVIVSIATELAAQESMRLAQELRNDGIRNDYIVVNRLLASEKSGVESGLSAEQYLDNLGKTQRRVLDVMRNRITGLDLTVVPYFDTEVRGPFGLKFMGQQAFAGPEWDRIRNDDSRFLLVGGKGGVGKTTMSSSLAVTLAAAGNNVAIVSTDPAHSLADALDIANVGGAAAAAAGGRAAGAKIGANWSGMAGAGNAGMPVRVGGVDALSGGTGSLYALEVDTEASVEEFRRVVREAGEAAGADELLGQLGIGEFADLLDNAPPGTDELIALAKVFALLPTTNGGRPVAAGAYLEDASGAKLPDFDYVIVDTAPTGHTLRLLAYPDFLDRLLSKVMSIRDNLQRAKPLLSMLGMSAGAQAAASNFDADARDRLLEFQEQMRRLQETLRDPAQAEFIMVAIATSVSMEETVRLNAALREKGIRVDHLVVNQYMGDLDDMDKDAYMERMIAGQGAALDKIAGFSVSDHPFKLLKLPYFDQELAGVYGLRALGAAVKDAAEVVDADA